ncbi:hypothetical protein L7F22_008845 [Adiantum nelumboides]|nr:hypothetical protein [Adiantum nelumboides]
MCSFVGLCQAYSSHMRNFSEIAAPLTDLLKGCKTKRQRVTVEGKSLEAFYALQKLASEAQVLKIALWEEPFEQIASHGLFDVNVTAKGDLHIDDHHTNEDIALAFGTALSQALGDRKGISRFGDFTAPLDEALVHVVLDLSGRPFLAYDMEIPTERVGTYDTQLVEHFFQSVVNTSGMTLHIRKISGKNSHHIIEACFKAFARALRKATEYDERRMGSIPSSKGVLSRA